MLWDQGGELVGWIDGPVINNEAYSICAFDSAQVPVAISVPGNDTDDRNYMSMYWDGDHFLLQTRASDMGVAEPFQIDIVDSSGISQCQLTMDADGKTVEIVWDTNDLVFSGNAIFPSADGLQMLGKSGNGWLSVNCKPVALAALGSAATAGAGTRAFINDGLTLGTWGATVVDGGSVVKPVWSNGTNWLNG
jgi:hypothetical protein